MTPEPLPALHPTRPVAGDWHVLPGWLPVPGLGLSPDNAFLRAGPEPMLVDTGIAALSDAVPAGVDSHIDLADLRWVWRRHAEADHIGNLDRILARAPHARVKIRRTGEPNHPPRRFGACN